jgi:hypothetical protein
MAARDKEPISVEKSFINHRSRRMTITGPVVFSAPHNAAGFAKASAAFGEYSYGTQKGIRFPEGASGPV